MFAMYSDTIRPKRTADILSSWSGRRAARRCTSTTPPAPIAARDTRSFSPPISGFRKTRKLGMITKSGMIIGTITHGT